MNSDDESGQVLGTRDPAEGTGRILGSLDTVAGVGMVSMRDRFDTDIADLWDAMTSPERLARWLGRVSGDLRVGGTVDVHYFASGVETTFHVETCEAPFHFRCDDAEGGSLEVWLSADGDGTQLLAEQRGMPVELLRYYGPGIQVHVEDLRSYLDGGERFDSDAMCAALEPAYAGLAERLTP